MYWFERVKAVELTGSGGNSNLHASNQAGDLN